mmetsp:Transcript_16711/g.56457  ORF Transcript_16711/g.56457 Transcript_16711/m.56457 type:complete len:207 (-) Transcript_16711:135-755(-)
MSHAWPPFGKTGTEGLKSSSGNGAKKNTSGLNRSTASYFRPVSISSASTFRKHSRYFSTVSTIRFSVVCPVLSKRCVPPGQTQLGFRWKGVPPCSSTNFGEKRSTIDLNRSSVILWYPTPFEDDKASFVNQKNQDNSTSAAAAPVCMWWSRFRCDASKVRASPITQTAVLCVPFRLSGAASSVCIGASGACCSRAAIRSSSRCMYV